MNWKVEKLLKGEVFITKEKGNSMVPLIKLKTQQKVAKLVIIKVK